MATAVTKEIPRETLNRRQLEVEKCLVEYGLRPRQSFLRDLNLVRDDGRYERLRAALIELGPVFASFGIYLSSRADLFSANDCLTLARITDQAAASPIRAIRELIDLEFGQLPAEIFPVLDDQPLESRLIFQTHRARLFSGEMVVVKVVHPELQDHLVADLKLLSILSKALPDLPLDIAIEDFRRTLKQQADFLRVAEMMAQLHREAPALEARGVPLSRREFCTSRVLTVEYISGENLAELLTVQAGSNARESLDRSRLANHLLQVWLQQSLLGGTFALDPRPENILIVHWQQIIFTGGAFASLPPDVKTNLYNYLIAVVNQDPDRACSYLLRELNKVKGRSSEDELRHRIRQAVPFRDGGWTSNGDNPSLAEYVFVHWRLAHQCGFRPQPRALSFFRGLFQVAATARQLAPAGDPFFQGLQDLRMEMVFAQFREMMTLNQLNDRVDKYAALMADFPERLNDALTLIAEGSGRPKSENRERNEAHLQQNSTAILVGLVLLLIAVVLLSRQVAVLTSANIWADRAGAVAFLLIGALLMRVACRA